MKWQLYSLEIGVHVDVEGDNVVALGLTARSFAEEVYKLNLELSQLLLVQRLSHIQQCLGYLMMCYTSSSYNH